jgi:hypothetical protein
MAALVLPRLPKEVYAPAGPVKVKRKARLRDDEGVSCDGFYVEAERTIYLHTKLCLTAAWPVLLHEQKHAWMFDVRMTFGEDMDEWVCNHFAACEMQQLLRRVATKKSH